MATGMTTGQEEILDSICDVVGETPMVRLSRIGRDLPVLFLSGYPEPTRSDAIASGAHTFIMKPFTPTTLTRKVRDVLNHAAGRS